jgi:hypothetical protein
VEFIPLQWGKHFIDSQAMFYAFNYLMPLQTHFSLHQFKVATKNNYEVIIHGKFDVAMIPFAMETHQSDLLGKVLFTLTHFRALCFTSSRLFSCLFPSITNDMHIISPCSIISSAYEHFQIKFHVISFFIQPLKCVAWSPSSLPLDFNTPF